MTGEILLVNKGFTDINPLVCGSEKCLSGHSFGPSFRKYYLLHYVMSGKGVFQKENRIHNVTKGQIFVIKPYDRIFYQADANDPWQYSWVGFESTLDLSAILSEDVYDVKECAHIFMALKECIHMDQGREFYICSKIFELIATLDKRRLSKESNESVYVLKAKNYIETNYMKIIGVQTIASHLNINRSYLSTIYKNHFGISPQEFLIHYRLERAAELIAAHGYKIRDAALYSGYTDVCNFSKMFKQKFGVSPAKYKY